MSPDDTNANSVPTHRAHHTIFFLAALCGIWGAVDPRMNGSPYILAALFAAWALLVMLTDNGSIDDHDVL